MFGSISIADPNTTVTSSFTAVEGCQVGVEDGYTVRVNQQTTASRLIDLKIGDKIEIDVVSAGANDHKFVPWTYNGNTSYFAVVSNAGSAKPTLRQQYRGKMWSDISTTEVNTFGYKTDAGVAGVPNLPTTSSTSGFQTTDLAVLLNPSSKSIHFIRADNAQVYCLFTDNTPVSHTMIWNGAANSWDSYALDNQGFIYRWDYSHNRTKSIVALPKARTIFSDGTTLYVAGEQFVSVLSDLNTITRTISTTETIQYGAALGDMAIVTTASGKAFKVGTGLELLFQTSMIASVATFQNHFVFAITEQYKLAVYDNLGTFIQDIPTGEILPWSVATWRDNKMVVAGADSQNVLTYTDLVNAPTIKSFPEKVSFAVPIGTYTYASYYLKAYQLTVPPNPVVAGPAFKDWMAPMGVDTGSGEYRVNTVGEDLASYVSPNATMLINGSKAVKVVSQNSMVQLYHRAYEGPTRAAVVLGNYAFDFKVKGSLSSSLATFINTGTKTKATLLVWAFKVPPRVVSAPIALTVGNLLVDGQPYDGKSLVSAGQDLKIIINVPEDAAYYFSVLSISDAQYPLIMGVASTKTADVQKFQPYGYLETTSVFKVSETGTYDFPNYRNAFVKRGEETLSFPTQLNANDELTVRHIQASRWWLDERDTVLIGPSVFYYAKSFTTVDDMPENVNFGVVHEGIPDFDSQGDKEPVITGLSEDYQITIYNKYMKFSVNGGLPVARPLVGNGDKVRAIYTVKNLFEEQTVKTLLADEVTVYEFGYLNIDPAAGQWMPARDSTQPTGKFLWSYTTEEITLVKPVAPEVHVPTTKFMPANTPIVQQAPDKYMLANTPVVQQAPEKYMPANTAVRFQASSPSGKSSIGLWIQASAPPGNASVGGWEMSTELRDTSISVGTRASNSLSDVLINVPELYKFSNYNLSNQMLMKTFVRPTYLIDQRPFKYEDQRQSIRLAEGSSQIYEPSFGISATYVSFVPVFSRESSVSPRLVNPFYVYQATKGDRKADTYWVVIPKGEPRYYGPGPRYLYGTVLRYHQRVWVDHTYKNDKTYAPGQLYMADRVQRNKPLDPRWFSTTNIQFKKLDGLAFVGKSSVIAPQFLGAKVANVVFRTWSIKGKAVAPAMPRKAALPGVKSALFTQAVFDPAPAGQNSVNWQTVLPLLTGGFATAAEAETAAVAFNNVLPRTIYQQPEGSFSYVFKRNTELVCQIKGTNIFAVKWLIGGG